ncbi:uncharacterized protein EAE98_011546 [Botrytis deweyae]|uniref:Prion-inhibition and propagation HeLo domain-containing protein n=1 Tax=Botrytis deweyae TaxID=2478750 RepID=A0ABQ7I5V0_9HELO|nr:uncharacterized protein EAE98_011546 [Botrytis deweyae]KAF7913521.1 hypothetical protein EAE98_011546 [Botrytis deweyae]
MILGSQADKANSSWMVNEIPSIQSRLEMQSTFVMVPSNTRLVNYQQFGRPSRRPIAETESDQDEARIEFKALIAELMKLKLVLIDLGEARLEKSIQRKLIVAKKSLKVSEDIAECQEGIFRRTEIHSRRGGVCCYQMRRSDVRACSTGRQDTRGPRFSKRNGSGKGKHFFGERMELLEPIVSHALIIRRGSFETGKRKYTREMDSNRG